MPGDVIIIVIRVSVVSFPAAHLEWQLSQFDRTTVSLKTSYCAIGLKRQDKRYNNVITIEPNELFLFIS